MRDKVVLITGGSAGFGRVLAETFARAGAKVAVTARDESKLENAVRELRQSNVEVEGFPSDVTQDDSVARLFGKVLDRFQRLDMLVNNVGVSTRGLIAETTTSEIRDLLEINFLSAVRCTHAALPSIRESRGHLVFMGSLASKIAARHLGGYPASKFALAAYAQQLRLELSPEGVHVLLVCPGPIARADSGSRYSERLKNLPESAARPGGGARISAIQPEALASKILRACERRQAELVVPWKARILAAIGQLSPAIGDWILLRNT